MANTKKTISALELQRQTGRKLFEPIWYMMQKLRIAMGTRDSKYQLYKIVELDEGFFESVDIEKGNDENLLQRNGLDSQKKTTVMVMVLNVHDFKKIKKCSKPTKFKFVRMLVVDNLKGQTFGEKVYENIIYDTVVKTDNYRSCSKIKDHV